MTDFANVNPNKNNFFTTNLEKLSKVELIAYSRKLHFEGSFKEAEKIYSFLLVKGFYDSIILVNYGVLLQQTGRIHKAIECFSNAINFSPQCYEAYLNLGNCQSILGKLEEAKFSTLKSINLNPTSPQAYINLGSILIKLGDFAAAEQHIRKAISIDPDIPEAHTNLATILVQSSNLSEAKVAIERSLELNPNSSKAQYTLGSIMLCLDNFVEAEIATSKAIKLNPKYFEAINQLGSIYKELGNLKKAETFVRKAIDLNSTYGIAFNQLGSILIDKGCFHEAKASLLRAKELSPNDPSSYHNLARICIESGNLRSAEKLLLKCIELNKNLVNSYYSLSTLNTSLINNYIFDYLFSDEIINNKKDKDKIDILFARANVLHNRKQYFKSSESLLLANKIKNNLYPSDFSSLFLKTQSLLNESIKFKDNNYQLNHDISSIFIVGMPRSGSTLLESIISLNNDVYDLGETDLFEKSYNLWKKSHTKESTITLEDIYQDNKLNIIGSKKITTDKNLYNYQFAGLIASKLNRSRLIHCVRNPLDNILSIFRSHFSTGNRFSSSLVDCANLYLQHDHVMSKYKSMYPSKIYVLNYDQLVNDPKQEIMSLITWLKWDWNDKYLLPHLNERKVTTASSVQVRSPIYKKSVDGWKNYRKMLLPAIDIITSANKFYHLDT